MSLDSPANLPALPLPTGITSSYIQTNDLKHHFLSAGPANAPLILLLHGFPELAFSYRKILVPLTQPTTSHPQGFRIIAPDQRGYGRTTGWDTSSFHDVDLNQFAQTRLVTDMLRLVQALGYSKVHCVVGHDFGAVVASWCAVLRPDFFRSVVLMSHPFKGTATFPSSTTELEEARRKEESREAVHEALAKLNEPRKAYKWFYSSAAAAKDMDEPKDALHGLLRGYFHVKSADWEGNKPVRLERWDAENLARMPYYYVMPLDAGMRESVDLIMKKENPAEVQSKSSRWLPDSDLAVYTAEFDRTGFQGGLNWYRRLTQSGGMRDTEIAAGKKIEVPAMFISGDKDWGMYQEPGAVENMESNVAEGLFRGVKVVQGAGHWVMQERAEEVVSLLKEFLDVLEGERSVVQ